MVTARRLLAGLSVIAILGCGSLPRPGVSALSVAQTNPEALSLHATIEAIGIVAPYTGDDNQNNIASVWYRSIGDPVWLAGPEMFVDRHAREWRVSLVHCSPATGYEVEVRYADPDGAQPAVVRRSVRTRPDYPDVGSGGDIWYVPDDGDLQAVIDAASAGDSIRIRAGTYYTSAELAVEDSGVRGSYLTIEAAPGAHVVLDGSDPSLNNASIDNWLHYQDSIYYTDLSWGDTVCDNGSLPNYVGEQWEGDGRRYLLYKGDSEWEDFLAAPQGKAYYDCSGRLYVVTYDADDPDNHEMHVSRRAIGLTLAGADHVRIRDLEVRYYGVYGMSLIKPGADHNVIEGNTFHGMGRCHVKVGQWGTPDSSSNLIQDNHFYERGYRDSGWTWDAAHHPALSVGVLLSYAGSGNVVRRNAFAGGWDAIAVTWQSHDTDVYANVIQECMDDGIEVDGEPGQNIRVWGNRIRYCFSSISNQNWFTGDHWNTGPIYIFRNVIEGGSDPQGRTDMDGGTVGYHSHYAFKVGTDEDWLGRVYYYHNTISILDSAHGGNGVQDAGGYYFSGMVSRNNLWNVRGRVYYLRHATTSQHDTDYNNLHNAGTPTDTRFILWSQSGGPEGDGVYRNLSDFQAYTGQELHSISDNGTLFNPDLSLRAGSPEIDAGCVIVGFDDRGPWAYQGPKPDIGAFEFRSGPDLSASAKTASPVAASMGGILTYTVRIVNRGGPLSATAVMTDMLPIGLDYLTGTLAATLGTAWVTRDAASASIHWQGVMNDTPVVEVRYGVRVEIGDTLVVSNTAWIDDGLARVIGRSAIILVNGRPVYLPIILRDM